MLAVLKIAPRFECKTTEYHCAAERQRGRLPIAPAAVGFSAC
jgi:hypothetical protein